MEIDLAVTGCADRRLQAKYNNATYVIQRAFALYEFEQIAFSFNGGKDSTVLLHLLRAGYYLHRRKTDSCDGNQLNCLQNCPIRTIYFESPSTFPEINSFTYETATMYDLQLETFCSDFKSGLTALIKKKPTKAIFIGTRIGDPNAVGQEQFSPSSDGWPPFMRVNPILDWSYRDVWAFLLTCKVPYCSLYDRGYTSIGSIYDTVPNTLLCISDPSGAKETFKPAYMLSDGRSERSGRANKLNSKCDSIPVLSNGLNNVYQHQSSFSASIIAVGDEILFGTVEDKIGATLCKKLHAIGWQVAHLAVCRNDIDSVAEVVEHRKSVDDMVFLFGGLGSLHSDVSLAAVAKAFGVRLAPDEEFEEYLGNDVVGSQCSGDRNEMALLPEGITELLHHEKLHLPLVKCRNVIILAATNAFEAETEWDCLMELPNTPLVHLAPYASKSLCNTLSDVEIAPRVLSLCSEFPDIHIGCHRTSRTDPPVIHIYGKDPTRIESASEKLSQSLPAGTLLELSSG